MQFEARELKSYAEPVTAQSLEIGEVYFSVQFVDEGLLVPIVETWVFAGKNLDPERSHGDRLYFQDVESYRQGIRYETAAPEEANFQVQSARAINHIFEYERALDQLMKCSLRRRKLAT